MHNASRSPGDNDARYLSFKRILWAWKAKRKLILLYRLLEQDSVQQRLFIPLKVHEHYHLVIATRLDQIRQCVVESLAHLDDLKRLQFSRISPYEPRLIDVARRISANVGNNLDIKKSLLDFHRVTKFRTAEIYLAASAMQLNALWGLYDEIVKSLISQKTIDHFQITRHFEHLLDSQNLDTDAVLEILFPFSAELNSDPSGTYAGMNARTKQAYRAAVESVAQECAVDPVVVVRTARGLAQDGGLHRHIGHYLLGERINELRKALNCTRRNRVIPTTRVLGYFACIFFVGMVLIAVLNALLGSFENGAIFIAAAMLCLDSAAEATKEILLRRASTAPIPAMQLDKSKVSMKELLVCLPVLLTSYKQIECVSEAVIRVLSVTDKEVSVVLITDLTDSETSTDRDDERLLIRKILTSVEKLNATHNARVCMLHRNREFSDDQGRYIGRDRKRGKVDDLIGLIVDGEDHFSLKVGSLERLQSSRYVLVIDEDSHLSEECAAELLSAAIHPLHYPQLDDDGRTIRSGSAMFVPSTSARLRTTKLAPILKYLASTPVDFSSLYGKPPYSGKGLFPVVPFHALLASRLPTEKILSHDTIESAFLAPTFVATALITESVPASFKTFTARQHRWYRGDMQNLYFLLQCAMLERNSDLALSKWTLFGIYYVATLALRRIWLVAFPFALIGVLSQIQYTGNTVEFWFGLYLLLFLPSFVVIAAALLDAGISFRNRFSMVVDGQLRVVFRVCLGLHWAAIALDALCRATYRAIKNKNLMEWKSSSAEDSTVSAGFPFATSYIASGISTIMVAALLINGMYILAFALTVFAIFPILIDRLSRRPDL